MDTASSNRIHDFFEHWDSKFRSSHFVALINDSLVSRFKFDNELFAETSMVLKQVLAK